MRYGNWFWQPELSWLNEVNTTNLRTVNAVRLSVAIAVMWSLAFGWASWHAVPHCSVEPCPPSMTSQEAALFAKSLFDSFCFFVASLAGIAVAGYATKRATDHEYVKNKKAPVIVNNPPPEPPPPTAQVNVGVSGSDASMDESGR